MGVVKYLVDSGDRVAILDHHVDMVLSDFQRVHRCVGRRQQSGRLARTGEQRAAQ
jgi:hypothetical protein